MALSEVRDMTETRVKKEETLLKQRKTGECELQMLEANYKRQKLGTNESKASQWVTDMDHQFYDPNEFRYKEDSQMDQDDLKQAQIEMCKFLELPTSILKEAESAEYESEDGESEVTEKPEIINLNIPSDLPCKACSNKASHSNPEDFAQFREKVLRALDTDKLFKEYAEMAVFNEFCKQYT